MTKTKESKRESRKSWNISSDQNKKLRNGKILIIMHRLTCHQTKPENSSSQVHKKGKSTILCQTKSYHQTKESHIMEIKKEMKKTYENEATSHLYLNECARKTE